MSIDQAELAEGGRVTRRSKVGHCMHEELVTEHCIVLVLPDLYGLFLFW
jgi:hypothetical protein